MDDEHLLSPAEAAPLLGLKSARAVQKMIKRGELTPARENHYGGRVFYLLRREDVEALRSQRERTSEA